MVGVFDDPHRNKCCLNIHRERESARDKTRYPCSKSEHVLLQRYTAGYHLVRRSGILRLMDNKMYVCTCDSTLLFEIDFSVGCICCIKREMFTGVSMHACSFRSFVRSFILSISIHLSYVLYAMYIQYTNTLYLYTTIWIWMAINDVKLSSIVKSEVGDWEGAGAVATVDGLREKSVNEQEPVNMCILYAWCVHLCVFCIVYVMGYTRISFWSTKKTKLFPIFVPLLTLLAVLFFLDNTTLTSIVHMSGVFLLSEWVEFFFTLRKTERSQN